MPGDAEHVGWRARKWGERAHPNHFTHAAGREGERELPRSEAEELLLRPHLLGARALGGDCQRALERCGVQGGGKGVRVPKYRNARGAGQEARCRSPDAIVSASRPAHLERSCHLASSSSTTA